MSLEPLVLGGIFKGFGRFGVGLLLAGGLLYAEDGSTGSKVLDGAEAPWGFNGSVFANFPHGQQDYLQPTFTADRERLHLEARYNYEDLQTGSFWIGANFHWGETVAVDATPMVGGVFGQTQGVAPGYRFALTWKRLSLSSEGEYLLDTEDVGDSYFYTWSEITVSLLDWLGVGLVGQRTRAYETERELQRGVLISVGLRPVDLALYLFNLDHDRPMPVLSLGVSF